jgi:hypothetical protein
MGRILIIDQVMIADDADDGPGHARSPFFGTRSSAIHAERNDLMAAHGPISAQLPENEACVCDRRQGRPS